MLHRYKLVTLLSLCRVVLLLLLQAPVAKWALQRASSTVVLPAADDRAGLLPPKRRRTERYQAEQHARAGRSLGLGLLLYGMLFRS
jgi:hypothetical protein